MENNLSASNYSIIDHFTPEVLGVIWIMDKSLTRDLAGFNQLNYLFDGLLSQYLNFEHNQDSSQPHIFFTENFGKKIFLLFISQTQDVASVLDMHMNIINELNSEERKTILILNKAHPTRELYLKYSQFIFNELSDY